MSTISQVKESTDRVIITQERKSSIERVQGEQFRENLGFKLATAEANRTVQLDQIRAKARRTNDRVLVVRERKTSTERAQEERTQESIQ